MLTGMRGTIARMGHGLPDKQRAANPIGQTVPLSVQAEPDRALARAISWNRPALGAGSCEGGGDSGAQSNRAGWLRKVWKGQSALPCRCEAHRRGWPSAGGNPQEDRTQISKPQVKSLHKCALRGATFQPGSPFNHVGLALCEAGSGPNRSFIVGCTRSFLIA